MTSLGQCAAARWAAVAALFLSVPAVAQNPAPARLVAEARAVAARISAVRGLETRRPIDFRVSDRATIRAYAEASLAGQMPAGQWAAYEALLVHAGMIPAGTDLEELVVGLYAEQIAGYYDPARKTFYLADWLPEILQRGVVAHEVTHALQDQHFDLEDWLSVHAPTEDGSLARAAVAEGDAMAAMLAYLLEPMGVGVQDMPSLSELLRGQGATIAEAYPSFDAAPAALQRLLLFPYVQGSDFVRVALERGGWEAVDALYRDPPASTEQILHPERYFGQRDEPRRVEIVEAQDAAPPLVEGSWGEFGTELALEAALVDTVLPAEAARGWDGDRYALWRDPSGGLRYRWITLWDTSAAAERFAEAYAQGAMDRVSGAARIATAEGRFELSAGGRTLELVHTADRVDIRETSRIER